MPALRAQKHNAPIYFNLTAKFNESHFRLALYTRRRFYKNTIVRNRERYYTNDNTTSKPLPEHVKKLVEPS